MVITCNLTIRLKQTKRSVYVPDHENIARILIEHGANVNAKGESGSIPLHVAANGDLSKHSIELTKERLILIPSS